MDAAYEGEAKTDLLLAWDGPLAQGDRLVVGIESADAAVSDFADALRSLAWRRADFETNRRSFNAAHAYTPEHELPPHVVEWYRELCEQPEVLQREYDTLVEACADALNGISIESVDIRDRQAERVAGESEFLGEFMRDFLLGLPGGADVRVAPGDEVLLDRLLVQLFGWDISSFVVSGTRSWGWMGEVLADMYSLPLPDGTRLPLPAGFTVPLMPPSADALMAPMGSSSGRDPKPRDGQGFLRGVKGAGETMSEDWNEFVKDMRMTAATKFGGGVDSNNGGRRFIDQQKLDAANARRKADFWKGFREGLPGVQIAEAMRDADPVTAKDGTVLPDNRMNKAARTLVSGAATSVTVVTTVATYADERAAQEAELRRGGARMADGRAMTDAEIENEAATDALAQTAGQVTTAVLASAATGAVAGSVFPGLGNAAGFVGGLVGGLAVSVPIYDFDGDGQNDSVAQGIGDGVEKVVDAVPEEVRQGVGEVLNGAEDLVGAAGQGVKDAAGGFVNWVTGR